MEELVLSQSGLKTWRNCHKLYDFKYIQNLEKVVKNTNLTRGSIVHAMIEAKANGEDPWEKFDQLINEERSKVFTEEYDEFEEMAETIEAIMEGYFAHYKEDDQTPVKINNQSAEHEFKLPLIPEENIFFKGIIDMITKDDKGRLWIMDHKTHKKFPSGDIAYINIQGALYAWGWQKVSGDKVNGIIWNYIKWKAPTTPELLKSGEMSKRANIDTTWGVYRKALLQAGLNPDDYLDMKEKLTGKEDDFFLRVYLPLNQDIINNVLEDAKQTALDIKHNAGKLKDRNISNNCLFCDFYNLCQAQLKGLDTELMLRSEYRPRKGDMK